MDFSSTLETWGKYFEAGGVFLYFMVVISVVVVALALERTWAVFRARFILRRVDDRVIDAARKGDFEEARRLAEKLGTPYRKVFMVGLDRALGRVKGDPAMAMLREAKRANATLKSGVWILGSCGALMPFVGLLGTVLGVMSSFEAIGDAGTGGFAVVSAGISEALVATAAGLFVALEAIVLFNWLSNMIGGVGRDLALLVDETLELISTRGGAHAGGTPE